MERIISAAEEVEVKEADRSGIGIGDLDLAVGKSQQDHAVLRGNPDEFFPVYIPGRAYIRRSAVNGSPDYDRNVCIGIGRKGFEFFAGNVGSFHF